LFRHSLAPGNSQIIFLATSVDRSTEGSGSLCLRRGRATTINRSVKATERLSGSGDRTRTYDLRLLMRGVIHRSEQVVGKSLSLVSEEMILSSGDSGGEVDFRIRSHFRGQIRGDLNAIDEDGQTRPDAVALHQARFDPRKSGFQVVRQRTQSLA